MLSEARNPKERFPIVNGHLKFEIQWDVLEIHWDVLEIQRDFIEIQTHRDARSWQRFDAREWVLGVVYDIYYAIG